MGRNKMTMHKMGAVALLYNSTLNEHCFEALY